MFDSCRSELDYIWSEFIRDGDKGDQSITVIFHYLTLILWTLNPEPSSSGAEVYSSDRNYLDLIRVKGRNVTLCSLHVHWSLLYLRHDPYGDTRFCTEIHVCHTLYLFATPLRSIPLNIVCYTTEIEYRRIARMHSGSLADTPFLADTLWPDTPPQQTARCGEGVCLLGVCL